MTLENLNEKLKPKEIQLAFEGMKFDRLINPPSSVHDILANVYDTIAEPTNSGYLIKYQSVIIAEIDGYMGELIFTPGFGIHRHINVFKTYNKLLRHFIGNRYFKNTEKGWVLCQE